MISIVNNGAEKRVDRNLCRTLTCPDGTVTSLFLVDQALSNIKSSSASPALVPKKKALISSRNDPAGLQQATDIS